MFRRILIVLIYSIFVSGKIKICINVASNIDDAKVSFSGYDDKVITEEEIVLFNLTEENINRGMRIELGRVPDGVFFKDPTPYEDLYKLFEWPEVKRHLRVKTVKVLEVFNENVTLNVYKHHNNTTRPIETDIHFLENIENTISSIWFELGLPDDDIYYDIIIYFGALQYKYENRWKNNTIRSVNLSFGVVKEGYMKINPGQIVTSILTARKTIILIEVEYIAKIIGSLIADYENLYGKYHFYAPTVAKIMRAAKLNNELRTTEFIEIRCYTDPKLEVFDTTGEKVQLFTPVAPFRNIKKPNLQQSPSIHIV